MVDAPWHVCGLTNGNSFSMKVWTGDETEPSWSDPSHVFTTALPDGWDYPGYSGGYIGHLHEGQTATFSGFETAPLCLTPDTVTLPVCQAALSG